MHGKPAVDDMSMVVYRRDKSFIPSVPKLVIRAMSVDGALLWEYGDDAGQRRPNLYSSAGDPVISNSDVIFWSEDGYLICLNKFNGQLRWEQQYPASKISLTNNGFLVILSSGRQGGWWRPEGWTTLYNFASPVQVVTPIIINLSDDSVYENDTYTGPTPTLNQGTLPV